MALISCRALDSNGREVPTATPSVTFTTNGAGLVYSAGADNTDMGSFCRSACKMYAGRATAAVKIGDDTGTLVVYAESDGLKIGKIEIPIV